MQFRAGLVLRFVRCVQAGQDTAHDVCGDRYRNTPIFGRELCQM